MYYAMVFIPNEWGNINVRALRQVGFDSLEKAKRAILNSDKIGYVKMLGQVKPVWSNAI
jgi:hypothetical protein